MRILFALFRSIGIVSASCGVGILRKDAIAQLGISFHDWLKLAPYTESKPDGAELMYIIPSKALKLQLSV